MTKKQKDKLSGRNLLLGLFFLIGYFFPSKAAVEERDLNTMTVTLSRDIVYIGGAKSRSFHRLWTNETKAAFKIEVPGGMAAKGVPLDSLKRGDTLTIKYREGREKDFGNKAKEIPVYHLEKRGTLFFDAYRYNEAQADYDRRWKVIFLIGAVLCLLRGMALTSSKTSFILGALAVAVLIVLRLMDKF
jgi:hypothetical protein